MKTATARTVTWAAVMTLAGSAERALAATGGVEDGSGLVIWGFISFCALIVVGQLLPAFVSFLAARKVVERAIEEELESGREKHAHAALDRE